MNAVFGTGATLTSSRQGRALGPGWAISFGLEADGDGFGGVVSLDLRRLDRVLEIDPISRAARIQAGVTGPRLESLS